MAERQEISVRLSNPTPGRKCDGCGGLAVQLIDLGGSSGAGQFFMVAAFHVCGPCRRALVEGLVPGELGRVLCEGLPPRRRKRTAAAVVDTGDSDRGRSDPTGKVEKPESEEQSR